MRERGSREVVVSAKDPLRLDRALVAELPAVSRGEARRRIAAGAVFVNGRRCRVAAKQVREGDRIRIAGTERTNALGRLMILFEDEAVIAIDKPAGMPAAPTRTAAAGTASEQLRQQLRRRSDAPRKVWVVHRLDTPTSGVMLFTLTRPAAAALSASFREHRICKTYLALVDGTLGEERGKIELPIHVAGGRARISPRGKPATTEWIVRERRRDETLVELSPQSGRMHQLRVHLSAIGHAIVGDPAYGGRPADRLMLHAALLRFPHPVSGLLTEIEAPPPFGLMGAS